MYSIKQVLKQEPAAVTGVLNLWLAFLCVAGVISWSGEIIAAFIAAVNATMLLLYVRPLVNSKDALSELASAVDNSVPPPMHLSNGGTSGA